MKSSTSPRTRRRLPAASGAAACRRSAERTSGPHATRRCRVHVHLHHPALNAVRIELFVHHRVQRIGHIHAAAVPAHLHHLRAAVQRHAWFCGMTRAPHNASHLDGAVQLRVERVAHVVLAKFTRSPARHVQIPVVEREVDVRYQRRHSTETLQQRWQQLRVSRFRGNLDHLLNLPLRVLPASLLVPEMGSAQLELGFIRYTYSQLIAVPMTSNSLRLFRIK